MNAGERRDKIIEILGESSQPVSASALAKRLNVSRQIIVGDVALLRAANEQISATPRGYVLEEQKDRPDTVYTIACRHNRENLAEELYTIVDNGGEVLDVIVEHPVYGQISGQLRIFSRYDVDMFLQKLDKSKAPPLSMLTDGVHLHTITCRTPEIYQRILAALEERNILFRT